MSTKSTLAYHRGEDGQPSWHLYQEAFEKDGVVYLELEGIQADVIMIDSAWNKAGTVLLRLPIDTAKQLGLRTGGMSEGWAEASRVITQDDSADPAEP